ncbi:MAG: GDSL-type esterase/lipase family protein, partial [Verrucomicrobiota bacterium]
MNLQITFLLILTGLVRCLPLEAEEKPSQYAFHDLLDLPQPDPNLVFGDRIRRTMNLLSTSTANRPNKVKILFYGQSITRQNYSREIIEAKLRSEYPHAQLEVFNTAIGGYQAPRSLLTMHHTLIPHQPDLVVFHVYGGASDGTYEEILKKIRKETTAELICVTHHLDDYGPEREAVREEESQVRRELAERYGAELIEVRKDWEKYLNQHHLAIPDLLSDSIHHNAHGGELWGALQARHFEVQPANPATWQDRITRIDLRNSTEGKLGSVAFDTAEWTKTKTGLQSQKAGASLKLNFEGTRVDIIAHSSEGAADVLIDGKRPSEISETWSATLPSKTPIDYRPAIMRVDLGGKPVAETWTLTVDSVNETGSEFSYTLRGSVSGDQGRGGSNEVFRSRNGIVEFRPEWFTLEHAVQIKKRPIPVPFDVTWEVYPGAPDEIRFSPDAAESNPSGQRTLIQKLPNG